MSAALEKLSAALEERPAASMSAALEERPIGLDERYAG